MGLCFHKPANHKGSSKSQTLKHSYFLYVQITSQKPGPSEHCHFGIKKYVFTVSHHRVISTCWQSEGAVFTLWVYMNSSSGTASGSEQNSLRKREELPITLSSTCQLILAKKMCVVNTSAGNAFPITPVECRRVVSTQTLTRWAAPSAAAGLQDLC